jgi:putative spermidine/putrescine transport system substrate-binding protein
MYSFVKSLRFFSAIMLVACCFTLLLSAGVRGQSAGRVVLASWGGSWQDALRAVWLKPFQKDTGIQVIDTSPIDYGKVKAMVLSHHVVWDVFEPTQAWVTQGIKDGLLEPLDYKVIPTDGVAPYYVTDYAVANAVYAMAITCRTDAYPNGAMPQSWAEFWDTQKFPGPRTLPKQPQQTLEIALMADGVSPDKLYPLDVERALKSLDKIRGNLPTWYENASTATQLLVDKEVKCAALYHNRVWAMQKNGCRSSIS